MGTVPYTRRMNTLNTLNTANTQYVRKVASFALFLALPLGLGACTVNVQDRGNVVAYSQSHLIRALAPDRGEGSSYAVGDEVKVQIKTATAGYLTLLALNNQGVATPLVQNAYIAKGEHTFPRIEDQVTYNTNKPLGTQRIRAIFTKVRPTTDLVIGGVYDGQRWNRMTEEYLSPYSTDERDVRETYIVVR